MRPTTDTTATYRTPPRDDLGDPAAGAVMPEFDDLDALFEEHVPKVTSRPLEPNGGEPVPLPVGMDAADLVALDLPPLRMVVPDVLPEGTTIVAAPPKIGKSCLIYQVVTEVALGGELLGRRVSPGSALYLALEDGRRRGQARVLAALAGRTMPRGRLEVRWGARHIGEGLEDDIGAWLATHPDAAVVAIDTLQRVRPRSHGQRSAYEVDVEDLGRLQNLFRDKPVALVIVHHSRKDAGDDFLASVSGTYGLTGSADSIVVLQRKRMETFGTIRVTGRDIPDAEVSVSFDGMLWSEAPKVLSAASFERRQVFDVIDEIGPIFPAAIAEVTGQSRQSVQNMVTAMAEDGVIVRQTGGYVISPTLARARDTSLPHVSSVFERHQSNRGVKGNPELPVTTVDCSDYLAHRDDHVRDSAGTWHCLACEGAACSGRASRCP